ncbi:MAG: pyridoxamine 5'-phosphate oxidase family protein, partial [Proteobacteria bacterium]|nr:pyridoxamine 5'-phosphate oxidase family protein [Pseudomonadota bacterium]
MNATTLNGPWTKPEVEAFLAQSTIPIRLAAVAQDRFPRVISLWFLYHASS